MAEVRDLQNRGVMIFCGNASRSLAEAIATDLMLPLGKAVVSRFSDGEVLVEVGENVRGRDIFVIQSVCQPTNDHLLELLLMADALRRASVRRLTAVVPYLGYARQDRRPRSARVPISAKLVANMIMASGVGHLVTVDLHAEQIQGFFDIPVDNIYVSPLVLGDLWRRKLPLVTVVSPDVGGVVRARAVAKRIDEAELAIIDKRRPRPNEAQVMNIIGEVQGRCCVIVDDLVDTAGTLCEAACALKARGASSVIAYASHAVLSGPAVQRIQVSDLDELVVSDTIALREEARASAKIRVLSVASMLAETIRRIVYDESVSAMYVD
jgi:ribose-phosphate pyrophosphokinase